MVSLKDITTRAPSVGGSMAEGLTNDQRSAIIKVLAEAEGIDTSWKIGKLPATTVADVLAAAGIQVAEGWTKHQLSGAIGGALRRTKGHVADGLRLVNEPQEGNAASYWAVVSPETYERLTATE